MSVVTAALPSRQALRNGLPGFRPYVYRGTGQDTLTAHVSFPDERLGQYEAPCGTESAYKRRNEPIDEDCRQANRRAIADRNARRKCTACGYRTTSLNHRTLCGGA